MNKLHPLNLKKSWNKSLPPSSFPSPLPSVWVPFLFSEFHHPHHLPCLFQRCHQVCFSFHTSARAECSQFYSPIKSKQDSLDDMSFHYELIWTCEFRHICIPAGTSKNSDKCNTIRSFIMVVYEKIYFEADLCNNVEYLPPRQCSTYVRLYGIGSLNVVLYLAFRIKRNFALWLFINN